MLRRRILKSRRKEGVACNVPPSYPFCLNKTHCWSDCVNTEHAEKLANPTLSLNLILASRSGVTVWHQYFKRMALRNNMGLIAF